MMDLGQFLFSTVPHTTSETQLPRQFHPRRRHCWEPQHRCWCWIRSDPMGSARCFDKHQPLTMILNIAVNRSIRNAGVTQDNMAAWLHLTAEICFWSNLVQLRRFGCWVGAENRSVNHAIIIRVNVNLATTYHESNMI